MDGHVLLRCLAGFLIVNSHLEALYPIPQLAADGLLGNSLFLLLSGYGLACSERKRPHAPLEWYGRRARRIYPAVFVVILVYKYVFGGEWRAPGVVHYVQNFVFAGGPRGEFYFVSLMLFYYLAYYWFLRPRSARVLGRAIACLSLPFFALPWVGRTPLAFYAFNWLFYFQVMLFGGWLAYRDEPVRAGRWGVLALLAACLPVYVALRLAVLPGRFDRWFFVPALAVVPMCYLLLRLTATGGLLTALLRRAWAARLAALVGGATLELYLLHGQVIHWALLPRRFFPLNVAAALVLSAAAACALAWAIGLALKVGDAVWAGRRLVRNEALKSV